jgi:transposase
MCLLDLIKQKDRRCIKWQEQLFQNAALALEGKRTERHPEQQKIEKLEQKIRQKDEVLAELMAEYIALKKEFGEL